MQTKIILIFLITKQKILNLCQQEHLISSFEPNQRISMYLHSHNGSSILNNKESIEKSGSLKLLNTSFELNQRMLVH